MAETVLGAVRQRLMDGAPTGVGRSGAAVSIGARVWRVEQVPEGATLPYLSLVDLGSSPAIRGDQRTVARRHSVSVDLWQRSRDASPGLLRAVRDLLDGAALPLDTGRAFRTRLDSTTPIPEPTPDLVHHSLTISLATDPVAV